MHRKNVFHFALNLDGKKQTKATEYPCLSAHILSELTDTFTIKQEPTRCKI